MCAQCLIVTAVKLHSDLLLQRNHTVWKYGIWYNHMHLKIHLRVWAVIDQAYSVMSLHASTLKFSCLHDRCIRFIIKSQLRKCKSAHIFPCWKVKFSWTPFLVVFGYLLLLCGFSSFNFGLQNIGYCESITHISAVVTSPCEWSPMILTKEY